MGREVTCSYAWAGETRQGKVMLENDALILAGRPRVVLPRAGLVAVVQAGGLRVDGAPDGPLVMELPEKEATAWARAIAKPPPDLAAKLGVAAGAVWVLGAVDDKALVAALHGARADAPEQAAQALAVITSPAELDASLQFSAHFPALPLWAVNEKGRAALPESAIRAAFRGKGWIDTKTCAVSDRLSATRYSARK